MTCRYCASSSPIYSASPCCQARLEADSRRHTIQREAIRIVALREIMDRRSALVTFRLSHGEEMCDALKAEIEKRWNGG